METVLTRSFLSIKKSWLRNLILTVIFAVIFAVVFSCGAIYSSSQKSIYEVSKLTSGALTIYGGDLSCNMTNSGWKSPYLKDAETFAESEYVETYNLALQPTSSWSTNSPVISIPTRPRRSWRFSKTLHTRTVSASSPSPIPKPSPLRRMWW